MFSCLFSPNDELGPAVLGPCLLGMAGIRGPLLSIAYRGNARRVCSELDQVVFGALRPLLPQGKVVLRRAPVIAVPFDLDLHLRVSGQPFGIDLQDSLGF